MTNMKETSYNLEMPAQITVEEWMSGPVGDTPLFSHSPFCPFFHS